MVEHRNFIDFCEISCCYYYRKLNFGIGLWLLMGSFCVILALFVCYLGYLVDFQWRFGHIDFEEAVYLENRNSNIYYKLVILERFSEYPIGRGQNLGVLDFSKVL